MTDGELGARGEESSETPSAATDPLAAAPAKSAEPPPKEEISLPGSRDRGRPPVKLSALQVAAIVALVLFTIFITWRTKRLETDVSERTAASALISKKAPDFSLAALSGESISLADYRGKKTVVVNYWASWCGPCRVELPQLRDFYNRYHKGEANFEILAISIDEEKSDAEKYATSEKLPFPVLLDPRTKTADAYKVEAIPTVFVIDKNGTVTYAHTGLDETMQFALMHQLGIKFSDTDNGGDAK